MTLPEYKTIAGNRINLYGVSIDDERFYVQNTNENECRAYAEDLVSLGYELYDKNEIFAGDSYIKRTNLSYTLITEKRYAFVFYDASSHTSFIVSTPPTELPPRKKDVELYGEGNCVFTQIALAAGGMSYVTRLCDGSFFIVDGGKAYDADVENLYSFLKSCVRADEKVRIAAWFFTHAHNDHIGLATKFLKKYKNDVEILAFAHQFPDCDKINVACDLPYEKEIMLSLCDVIRENYADAAIYYMHTGQRYYFSGATLEVLSSMDNSYPSLYFSLNDTSVVTRLTFDSGNSVLLLADATHHITRALSHTYGTYLKSDYLQLAHHGLIGGDIGLYKLVDPDVCLWPVSAECFVEDPSGQKHLWCLGYGDLDYNVWIRDESVKIREHYDHSKTVSFEI